MPAKLSLLCRWVGRCGRDHRRDTLAGGFGGQGACGGADGEPLGGPCDTAEEASAFGGMKSGVAFAGECDGFGLFIGEIGLRGGEPGLAGFAVEREVVERFEVLAGEDDLICGRGVGRDVGRRFAVWWSGSSLRRLVRARMHRGGDVAGVTRGA